MGKGLKMGEVKKCRDCGSIKPTTEYYKHLNTSDRLRHECKQCIKDRKKEWYEANKERAFETHKKYWSKRPERLKVLRKERKQREYAKHHEKYKMRAKISARRLIRATPPWLNEEHRVLIKAIYEHARDCEVISGFKYHVDHEVPIKGKNVCGLHVPWNLQVLPQDINDSKGNKFDGGWDAYI